MQLTLLLLPQLTCPQSSFSPALSVWKYSVCDVDLHVACTVKQKDWTRSEEQQLKQQTTAPSRDCVKSLYDWMDVSGPSCNKSWYRWYDFTNFLFRILNQIILDIYWNIILSTIYPIFMLIKSLEIQHGLLIWLMPVSKCFYQEWTKINEFTKIKDAQNIGIYLIIC